MKKFALLLLAALAVFAGPPQVAAQAATPAPVVVFQGSDGSGVNQYSLTLTAGQGMVLGSGGQLVPWTPPTVLASRAGVSTGTAGTSRTVVFSTPMPSTAYAIAFTGANGIGALQITYSNKTANGFTINMSVSTASAIDWTATQSQ